MAERPDKLGLLATFPSDINLERLRLKLYEAGIREEQVSLLSPIPLTADCEQETQPFWPYAITIAAGIVGIAVGLFFAGGTAALYPLMTGGKPIVSAPIVGIISYETMMLLAIVITFITMIERIRRAQQRTVDREAGIDEGRLALSVKLIQPGQEAVVRTLLERAGAEEIRLVSPDLPLQGRQRSQALAVLALLYVAAGCSPDMQEQPSYRSQEAPRLHSPSGSIPRESRALVSRQMLATELVTDRATELYRLNCLPCHGEQGEGTGPVAPYLNTLPANLRAKRVRALSKEQLYSIITNGKDMMPSFKGELSATERMTIVSFVQAMEPDVASPPPSQRSMP